MVSRRKRSNSSVGNKLNNLTDKVTEQQKLQQVSGTQTNAVTNDSIALGAVNTESVTDRSITSAKIGRGEVTSENLGVINEIIASGGLDIEAGVDGHLSLSGGKYEDPYDGIEDGLNYKVVAFDPTNNAVKIIDAYPPAENGLRFDTTYTGGSTAPGMLSWNTEDETLEVQVGSGNVTLQVGQESHVRGMNNTGSTIQNGTVVYLIGGSNGNGHPYIAPYLADGSISPFRVVGITTESIASGVDGLVTVQGKVRGLDTSGYLNGDVLYASTSVYGGTQNTLASSPNDIVSVGVVALSDATNGEILVSVSPVLNQLQTNLVLFPTTTASDVGGYYKLVDSTLDADYDSPAVGVSTGTLNSADDVLVGSLIADANQFVGDLGDLQVTVAGSITKTSGNANTSAGFYFKVFKRTSSGTEILMGTSDVTSAVLLSEASPVGPFAFTATANVVFETFVNTDRLVVKFYANTVENGTQSYTFTYGGDTPVRIIIPAPATFIVEDPIPQSENYIINGRFDIWQRGSSFSSPTSGAYSADRWRASFNGSGATRTISRQTFTLGTAPVSGYEGEYFYRYAQTVAGTNATFSNILEQPIEDVRTLAGQTITVSFWAKADATRTVTPIFTQYFGTGGGGSPSGSTTTNGSAQTLTTSWVRYSSTVTIPSLSGKTIGPSGTDALILTLQSSTINATQTIDIWGVQVEAGSFVTAFRRNSSSLQAELAACQRYYQRITAGQAYSLFASGVFNTTTAFYMPVHLPVTMRTVPAFSWSGAFRVLTSGAGTVATLAMYDSSTNPVSIQGTITGSTTDGQAGVLSANNDVAAYIEFDSEL